MKKRIKKWFRDTELFIALVFCMIITNIYMERVVFASYHYDMEMKSIEDTNNISQDFEIFMDEEIQMEDEEIMFSSSEEPAFISTPALEEQNPNLDLTVETDTDAVKAGQKLVYIVTLENTGNVDLHNVTIKSVFSADNIMERTWEDAEGFSITSDETSAEINILEKGRKRQLYYTVKLPEEMGDVLECRMITEGNYLTIPGDPVSTKADLKRESSVQTRILPLTVDFSVTKTADRSMAVPGDTITYQICIKNTGERTLHSVLTTERFQMEGVHAVFKEKEGVLLNGDKTQALISKIDPGKALGLEAEVVLPDHIDNQELFNYVTVVTKETGEKTVEASASIEIYGNKPELTEIPVQPNSPEDSEPVERTTTVRVSSNPKTGDQTNIFCWLVIFGVAVLVIICIFWILKAQRKH